MTTARRSGIPLGLLARASVMTAIAVFAPAAAEAQPTLAGGTVAVAVGSAAAPAELQAWDARLDAMIRSGALVVMSRTADPDLPGRTHEYAAQFVGGVPVHGAGVSRQFDAGGATVSAFGTLHDDIRIGTTPTLTAAEAALRLEAASGARLAAGTAPALTVLPLPDGSYVLAWWAALDDVRWWFASAADGGIVRVIDARREQQNAIGTGRGHRGDTRKMTTLFRNGRYEAHDRLRPGEIVTLDGRYDEGRIERLLAPGPLGARRWTAQDLATDADNVWTDRAVVDGHVHLGWMFDYFARQHGWEGMDGRRARTIGIVNAFRMFNAFYYPPPFGPEGRGVVAFGEFRSRDGRQREGLVDIHVVGHEIGHGVIHSAVAQRTGSPRGLGDAWIVGETITVGPWRFTDRDGATHLCRSASFPVERANVKGLVDAPALCTDDGRFLLGSQQGSAIHEALADTFAISAGFFHQGAGAGAGYDLRATSQVAIRSLSNPRAPVYPRRLRDRAEFVMVCVEFSGDNCRFFQFSGALFFGGKFFDILEDACCYGAEHWNASVISHAYYLAVEGGTNQASRLPVTGVGAANRADIEKIFFRGLRVHMPAGGTLRRAGAAIRQAAADLHAPGSPPYRAIHEALTAAGI